jgi:hypothetical protein
MRAELVCQSQLLERLRRVNRVPSMVPRDDTKSTRPIVELLCTALGLSLALAFATAYTELATDIGLVL